MDPDFELLVWSKTDSILEIMLDDLVCNDFLEVISLLHSNTNESTSNQHTRYSLGSADYLDRLGTADTIRPGGLDFSDIADDAGIDSHC